MPPPDFMMPMPVKVMQRRQELATTWTLDVETGPDELAAFTPGQFNMLYVFGVGEIPVSFSGDPAGRDRHCFTVRAVGPVSRALTELPIAASLGKRGPYGTGWPLAAAEGADLALIAGGLGLAPLRPVLYHVLRYRQRYGRITLLYGTRSPSDILFRDELDGWRRRQDLEVRVTVDHAGSEWPGQVGVVPALVPTLGFDASNTVAFLCGPEVMMRLTASALLDAGLAPAGIYLSMERNMKCALGHCGHCQFGGVFVCKDGPVLPYPRLRGLLSLQEL
ncbi:FAD/NAD(P)-binding protein [Marinobacter caseinilyticus]|uniref:FAD/NAD(P)-binding protein n=1 Tax=Marinobacter caseinilyticus TaxID=2692195 RepID=UPI00140C0AC3|nr:FAD/NAD(P)-binding protein [Marinobacter caseinilyticus]